jgi:LPXTG-motif cell wall-anchored protein
VDTNRTARRTMRLGLGTLIVGAVMLVGGMAPASAEHVDPVDFVADDNPSCTDVNVAYVNEFKINTAPANQVYDVSAADSGVEGGATITISNAGVVNGVYEFDWASSIGWDAVIVKQGDGAAVYTYVTDSMGDTNLHPSLTNGQPTNGISHVTFCRDNVTTTTTESTTTTTEGTTTSETVLGTVVTQGAAPTTSPTVLGAQVTRTLPATGTSTTSVLATLGTAMVLAGGIALLVGARKARLG